MHTKLRSFRIVLLNSVGKKRAVELSTEDKVAEFLKATYLTEAPLSLEYSDGSRVEAKVIEQIYARVFSN